ncbi:peptidase family M50 [Desulfosporosinus acididurans]|uniref:Peptidase family M50 n=1 Tax=Desulfosporosinus acididurans TaxID=476652 RepID=A0A0J1FWJ4_9FIRM|nr:site-2 protease family protein [Desulfosporosinus acididurans]KLU67358.1 peptidase family M50 [Desulfosporosinus acididurans]
MDNNVHAEHQNYVPPELSPKKKKGLAGVIAVIIGLLVKFKAGLLLVLPKLKFVFVLLKLGKFGTTAFSMLITIVIYARIFGWMYAVGFVALLFAHEMGHYIMAKWVGLPVSGPIFIPFVGALIQLKEPPVNAKMDAQVGYAGPFAGSLAAGLLFLFYLATGSKLVLALSYTGFFLNLFNLIPVHPLDGGRVTTAISPYLWLIGIPILIYFTITSFNPILVLIIILGGIQIYKHWKGTDKEFYEVSPETRNIFAVLYFGLLAGLGSGVWYTLQILETYRRF